MTGQFAALVLDRDASALARLACSIDLDVEAANDACFDDDAWLKEQAQTEDFRHARW